MKLSTIFLVLAGTSQALVASTRSNNVDIDAGSHAMPLMSRSKIFSDQWFKEGWDKFIAKLDRFASDNATPAKRHEMPDSADIPLLATATGLYPTATGLYPTATGAPMPTGTSTSSTEQEPANASLRRRTKHFYPKDLSIDYKLAPKAPVKVRRDPDAAAAAAAAVHHSGFKVKSRVRPNCRGKSKKSRQGPA